MIKILILTKQELIGESIKLVLSAHQDLQVKLADNWQTAPIKNDIIMLDMGLSDTECLTCIRKTVGDAAKLMMLQLTGCGCTLYNFSQVNCLGYLLQSRKVSLTELYPEIQRVWQENSKQTAAFPQKVVKLFSQAIDKSTGMSVPAASVAELSASEWEIIQKIKLGLSNKEISQKLFLSEGTVRNYLSNILSKLALRDRTQLAIWALQNEGIMAQTTSLA
ncbi:MAG: response regulator transcription factor [Liquorilactobacillus nagelii]|jgi:DNA-binding NarL/FixJ family response regulator|uniref:HTH luxR-type domain-containing protein n=2 Tax=Liquorilactobacillus nagelii TaxID=82688 RepID=A0A3S6QXQ1_9LACO|nr:response regulator transcription factor [Liquorilactobacillus nagelii]AUJ32833.1 hypothetical protein BSQ50_09975 [Liquorilactobacillus nagelii]KRL41770.1 hypothetical protein FD45_GL000622 [Liquorilactobacillus nagelii DSM 13675]MCC7616424.1 DNA-binding response regulator [Liquorilactobacillus nagelii]MCI1699769.1 response regulator transcription factor [Liquorilactobacillus nagelii]MCP9315182.1 response regulator transcription factor [Liquorilactobacillus nagelii]